ncbi:DUF2141 domain-containing protein [Flavobacteriaceae bacterium F08102]|nr:DUF2141 domain-containing protein [Flavobacteriaceae bacterium F08102]
MIRLINFFSFLLLSLVIHAQTEESQTPEKETFELTVNVPNVTSDKGKMVYALYTSENFLAEPGMASTSEIKDGTSSTVFKDVIPGTYAVIVYHDVNGNGKLDMNEYGMPMEDYSLSNNPRSMGPPQFQNAKFTVEKSMTLEIKL